MNTFIEKLAGKITDLGLTGPAILLLEANKPLAFLGSQLLLVAQPTLDMFATGDFTRQAVDLLADPEQVEQLTRAIENRAAGSGLPGDSFKSTDFKPDSPPKETAL